jgi:hypothetical protein
VNDKSSPCDDEPDGDEPEDKKPEPCLDEDAPVKRYEPRGCQKLSDGSVIFWW